LKAIEEKKKISCKQIVDRGNLIFSEEKQIEGLDFCAENNRIIIYGIENGEKVSYLLGDLIDVEII
jgi:hypothetical protein